MSKETDSDSEPRQLQYKVIILGDGAVGKTSIAMRHTEDNFLTTYKQTIGLDFFLKRMAMPDDTQVTLQIWDIGGQSIGGKMLKNYIYGAQAVLLVYDITNYESFQNLEDWYRLVRRTFDDERMPYVALVGNKSDLNHLRAVKDTKHKQFTEENDLKSYLVSAKTGDEVNTTFRQVAADLAGIALTKADLEREVPVLKAQIINHEQNDPDVKTTDIRSTNSKCSIQ
ncbi:ras family [Plasmopara halstedii]|uniref:Ras family n=1 Tax=Plasmopara halstedii TaxID=4781 RepID=A0A0P1A9D8_PLAHL|nr:ras family [Plasmopara halstedii]CEG37337.1 ras family [Plasmopara halstedii]|eukprot:XP_024573706.1 ras family [Plasmopara halstedii]